MVRTTDGEIIEIQPGSLVIQPGLYVGGVGSFEPLPDITPMEAVRVAVLLASINWPAQVDFVSYIDEHGLRRHFSND